MGVIHIIRDIHMLKNQVDPPTLPTCKFVINDRFIAKFSINYTNKNYTSPANSYVSSEDVEMNEE